MKVGDIIQFDAVDGGPNKEDRFIVWYALVIEVHHYGDELWDATLMWTDGTMSRQQYHELEFTIIKEEKICQLHR